MLESYFFIPGDKLKYINKVNSLDADYFVFDLEDSVAKVNKHEALKNLLKVTFKNNYFVRVPLYESIFNNEHIVEIVNSFRGNIVVPKVIDDSIILQLKAIFNTSKDLRLILLIESPIGVYNINKIIEKHNDVIYGIGFGTHDFCTVMDMKHNEEHLNPYKKQLILIAKTFGVKYIDGVNLQFSKSDNFINECLYALDAGANGKFIIHPNHLLTMNNMITYNEKELNKMRCIYDQYLNIGKENHDIIVLDGEVYEKPHLLRIEKILNQYYNK